ncbi:MAG: hypothetical protein M3506_00410 [Chloroflexota bacterium]|nr:hypothetical protein [Chloroflexota bacterium]
MAVEVVYRDESGAVTLGSLSESLEAVLGMFLECRGVHGMSEEQARWAALSEVIEGTKANGEDKLHPEEAAAGEPVGVADDDLPF